MDVVEKRCDYRIQIRGQQATCGEPVPRNIMTEFAVAQHSYKADLCANHQNDLTEIIAPFINIARPGRAIASVNTRGRKVLQDRNGTEFTTKDVRVWLKQKG